MIQNEFEYGGYHFIPYRKFQEGEIERRLASDSRSWKNDAQYAMRNMRSDASMKMPDYNYDGFYAASTDKECDIFNCVENDRQYVPGANELFEYTYDSTPQLNGKYWDCECEEKYIHRASVESCSVCGALRDEMPDSRQNEIDEGDFFAGDEMAMLEAIEGCATKEFDEYKAEMLAGGANHCFSSAYSINIAVEVMNYMTEVIVDDIDEQELNNAIPLIYKLFGQGIFLKELLRWAANKDYADVGNYDATHQLIIDFCDMWLATHGE